MFKNPSKPPRINLYQVIIGISIITLIISLVFTIKIMINLTIPGNTLVEGVSPQEKTINQALELMTDQTSQ